MFERVTPQAMRWWLVLAAVVYLVLPYDFLPDFLGLIGRVDDLLLMGCLAWFFRNHARRFADSQQAAGSGPESDPAPVDTPGFDPYEVLGISPDASQEAIRAAYRRAMQQYHPDKVAHLGEALQKVALEKTQQIQKAYRALDR